MTLDHVTASPPPLDPAPIRNGQARRTVPLQHVHLKCGWEPPLMHCPRCEPLPDQLISEVGEHPDRLKFPHHLAIPVLFRVRELAEARAELSLLAQ
eukprot:CAMPEP_0182594146 /NCGR_PEP_ID=MMETSP1324-20130603/79543_1 /TAXON_ID=236786 /ORGANISM="Florenciella sp., Strain RCC1587" /LENGTH=95 /DNA_ID=CAMNT_0024811663 /DNA_START=473 /DNA_END=760 /DNA_ORIENTATION=+